MRRKARILSSKLTRTCFFSNMQYSVSSNVFGQLFVCFSVVIFETFFFAVRIFFLMLLSVFDLLLQFILLLCLTSYILLFSCFAKKLPRSKLFQLNFYRPSDLILGLFKGNLILTLFPALFNLVICLSIGLLKFFFGMEIYLLRKSLWASILIFFSQKLYLSNLSFWFQQLDRF